MKLLLCSDFSGVGYKYVKKFFKQTKGLNALFVGYAQDDEFPLESSAAVRLKKMGVSITILGENYDFSDKIDIIFVRGGNTTRLIHYLRKYGQFEKLKSFVETSNVLYIGNSAGAVLCGSDTEWTLDSEPYEYDLKQIYGENALFGFGWIDKMVFVHCSKYRMCREYELGDNKKPCRTFDNECYPAIVKYKKIYKPNEYIKIGNNQCLLLDGDKKQLLTYNWNKLPIKKI